MQSFSKLRNNLTIIYTLVTAGITIIIAVLLWLSMSISIESNAGSTLEVTAQQLAGTYDVLLADNFILNSVIKAENEAQEKSLKKRKDERDHPGMERFESVDDFWDEVEAATVG